MNNGLTLPMWVAASAKAATALLVGRPFDQEQQIVVLDQQKQFLIPVCSVALIQGGSQAIGISRADSGINLDITKGLEVWVSVQWMSGFPLNTTLEKHAVASWLSILPGQGVGKHHLNGEICLSAFAKELLLLNLRPLVPLNQALQVEIIFPRGGELAKRTSNEAFGVVDGLALIGTQAESQISASPEQIQDTIQILQAKAAVCCHSDQFVFVIGENGFDLAVHLGIPIESIVKVGNWLGPLLVAAAELGIKNLLIFGYHGKLVKVAGGIFHTHHHLADGRLEVLTALAVAEGLPLPLIQSIGQAGSVEEAFLQLEAVNQDAAHALWLKVASVVELRSKDYVGRYGSFLLNIGAALFDKQRQLRWTGPLGFKQLEALGVDFKDLY